MKSTHTYTITRLVQKLYPVGYYDGDRSYYVGEVEYVYAVYFTDENGNTKRRCVPHTPTWNKLLGKAVIKHNMKVTHYNAEHDIIIVERR